MHAYQFYISPQAVNDGCFSLEGDEFRHCCRVLRKTAGETIDIFDGKGRRWSARLESVGKNRAECRIIDEYPFQAPVQPEIRLGIGLIKSNLLDEIVVNATALGVTEIVPLLTIHSIKTGVNRERLEKLALSALKQSGMARAPRISDPLTLDKWLDLCSDAPVKLITEQHESVSLERIKALPDARRVAVMIGPEGGFAESEIRGASLAGFAAVNIFPYRLRTELAAVMALAGIRTLAAKYNEVNYGN